MPRCSNRRQTSAAAVPDIRRQSAQLVEQDAGVLGAGAARGRDHQTGVLAPADRRQLVGKPRHRRFGQTMPFVRAADQHGHARLRQMLEQIGEPRARGGEFCRRHAMDRGFGDENIRAASSVMTRQHQHIEPRSRDRRRQHLHDKAAAARRHADRMRGRRRALAATDQQVRPGRRQRIARRIAELERPAPQARRHKFPRRARHKALDLGLQPHRFGQADGLIDRTGVPLGQNPTT